MSTRAHIALPPETLSALDRAAAEDRRTRSATVELAVEQYLRQRSSVTGESRLRDLERRANQHTEGAPVITADKSINERLEAEAKMPAPSVSPPSPSHMTAKEKREANDSFLKGDPNARLVGGK